jgi:hypothetical protein
MKKFTFFRVLFGNQRMEEGTMPNVSLQAEKGDVWTAVRLAAADVSEITGESERTVLRQFRGREEYLFLFIASCVRRVLPNQADQAVLLGRK